MTVHKAIGVERVRTIAYCVLALLVAASIGVLVATNTVPLC